MKTRTNFLLAMHPATQRATTGCTFAAAAAQENIPSDL
jgi:hypothetical protein